MRLFYFQYIYLTPTIARHEQFSTIVTTNATRVIPFLFFNINFSSLVLFSHIIFYLCNKIISLFSHQCNSFLLFFQICRFLLNFVVLDFLYFIAYFRKIIEFSIYFIFCIYFFHLRILLLRCFYEFKK